MTKLLLALIGTGGTIAGAASAASVSTDYKPASLSLAAVVDTVPELRQRYAIEVTQAQSRWPRPGWPRRRARCRGRWRETASTPWNP